VKNLVESTAVYPTKYYVEQLKDVDPRFYMERKMVVTMPQKNLNAIFTPEAIVFPGSVKVERLLEQKLGEEQTRPQMIEVPLWQPTLKPLIDITSEDIQHALKVDIVKEIGAGHLTEKEMLEIKQALLSWIEEMAQDRTPPFTKEAKAFLMNVIALIMKKTSDIVKESEG